MTRIFDGHLAPEIVDPHQYRTANGDVITRGSRNPLQALAGAFLVGFPNVRTRDSYKLGLLRWFEFAEEVGFDPLTVRRSMVELYVRELEGKGLAPATVNSRLTALASFYEWLVDEEYIVKSPMKRVRRPKIPQNVIRPYLGRHELADFIDQAEVQGGYDFLLACLLAHNGLRVSEITGADVEDLGGGRHEPTLRIMGKGSKPDIVPLTRRTVYAVDLVLGTSARSGGGGLRSLVLPVLSSSPGRGRGRPATRSPGWCAAPRRRPASARRLRRIRFAAALLRVCCRSPIFRSGRTSPVTSSRTPPGSTT